jgi:hypothetical protein
MDLVIAYLNEIGGQRPQDRLVNCVLSISTKGDIRIDRLP